MTDKTARECDYCHKVSLLKAPYDSNGMVCANGASLILMIDIKPGETERPTFDFERKHWHPSCLLKALKEWFARAGIEVE